MENQIPSLPTVNNKCFLHCFEVSKAENRLARTSSVPQTLEDGPDAANIHQNGSFSSSSKPWAGEGSSWDNRPHSSSLLVSPPPLGSCFLCKTAVILIGCHLLIKVIWEFSQHTDHKIGPCRLTCLYTNMHKTL